ncbi:MAG TPA: diguanylate cyclase [Burkholderiaceae bacterium]|nr:diguanylate cyclase [Burkholderiaceae bacterium]
MRAVLIRLLQDVVQAESRLDASHAAQLVEANEQLVILAVRQQEAADTAAAALSDVQLDALTQLPARRLMRDRLSQAIASAKRRDASLALLFVDLNFFKEINDTMGHAVGDQVLQRAARCIASSVREADTVSRHGGDEFLILLTEISAAADAERVAAKVSTALAAPARFGDHVLRLSASIGISIYPQDGEDADALIDRADTAMYRAKRDGTRRPPPEGVPGTNERDWRRPFKSLHAPVTALEKVIAEHEVRYGQLQEANEQLLLSALNARDLQTAAEQAHARQTEFLGVIAHELRNPLAPIRVATTMLGRVRSDEPLLPRAQQIINRQMDQLTRLVDDLLDVTRAEVGKLTIDPTLVDLVDVIDDAIEVSRPAMDLRLQSFVVEVPSRALTVNADRMRLGQAIVNLLNNASKYSPESGRIALTVEATDDSVSLSITDNGIGISQAMLPTIFDPFVQDSHAVGFNGTGLGVGLTVVRELIRAHAGSVRAHSAGRGEGSEFVVVLPLALRQAP